MGNDTAGVVTGTFTGELGIAGVEARVLLVLLDVLVVEAVIGGLQSKDML